MMWIQQLSTFLHSHIFQRATPLATSSCSLDRLPTFPTYSLFVDFSFRFIEYLIHYCYREFLFINNSEVLFSISKTVISAQFQIQCILKPKSTTKIFVLVRASVMFLSLYVKSDTASLQAIFVLL
jgi:hypothetical protein